MSASKTTSTANGIASLKAVQRAAERFGRIAFIASLVNGFAAFCNPFLAEFSLGFSIAVIASGWCFLRIADACAQALHDAEVA